MLVFREVSSMKPRRCRKLRMKGWRPRIHHFRASRTSERFCSTARRSFLICQIKSLEKTADGRAVDLNPLLLAQGNKQLIKRGAVLLKNVSADPELHAGQLASARIALTLRRQTACLALQLHYVVDELHRHAEVDRRS